MALITRSRSTDPPACNVRGTYLYKLLYTPSGRNQS